MQYNTIAKFKGQCFETIFTVKISQFCGSTSGADCSIQPRVCIQLDALARRLPVSTATGERWTEDLRHWFRALPSLQFRRLIGSTFNYDFFFFNNRTETSSRFKSMCWFLWQNDDVSVTQNKDWPTGMAYILRGSAPDLFYYCFVDACV